MLFCDVVFEVTKNYFQVILRKNFQGVHKLPKNHFQGVYKVPKNYFQGVYKVPKNFQGLSK